MKPRDKCLHAITHWASGAEDVEALILTGSLARNDNSADDLSDIDIEIITSRPEALIVEDKWLSEPGQLVTVLRLDPEAGQQWATRLAIYNDGVKVDFTLAGTERLIRMIDNASLCELYQRGYHILLDKTGMAGRLPAPAHHVPARALPSPAAFTQSVEEFWFEAFHIPKYLARGDLWMVKLRDNTMKTLLLSMLEWHSLARSQGSSDTWHHGLHMNQWADAQTWDELQATYGRFDATDAQRAFEATLRLYGRLGREVAQITGLFYPQACEDAITSLNRRVLAQDR